MLRTEQLGKNPFDNLNRWLTGGKRPYQRHQAILCATLALIQRFNSDITIFQKIRCHSCLPVILSGNPLPFWHDVMFVLLTCVVSVTDASCRYSELPHPYSCPSVDTARLQSPYVLICCTSTPVRSPPTSTGLELTLWCPRPEMSLYSSNCSTGNFGIWI